MEQIYLGMAWLEEKSSMKVMIIVIISYDEFMGLIYLPKANCYTISHKEETIHVGENTGPMDPYGYGKRKSIPEQKWGVGIGQFGK